MTTIPKQRLKLIDVFVERNSKINLSAIRAPEEIYQKHILDALELTKLDRQSSLPVISAEAEIQACDLGTWWWFPLLPLAFTYPDIQRTGLDARRKKIDVINDICSSVWLKNCSALHGRGEEHITKYDIVTARAVAYADTLLPRVDQILRPWWVAIFYKLYTPEEDKIIKKHKRELLLDHRYTLPDDEVERVLYVLKK